MDNIYSLLDKFIEHNDIPNLLFHGMGEKKKYVDYLLNKIYSNSEQQSTHVLQINCSFGGGINYIRNDLKFFGKQNMCSKLKFIILNNADKLTTDAQSALRRIIEEFNKKTRFILTVNDSDKILNPILSRFSLIYSDLKYEKKFSKLSPALIKKVESVDSPKKLNDVVNYLSKKTTAYNLLQLIKKDKPLCIFYFNKIKNEIRDEKLLVHAVLLLILRPDYYLENIII